MLSHNDRGVVALIIKRALKGEIDTDPTVRLRERLEDFSVCEFCSLYNR